MKHSRHRVGLVSDALLLLDCQVAGAHQKHDGAGGVPNFRVDVSQHVYCRALILPLERKVEKDQRNIRGNRWRYTDATTSHLRTRQIPELLNQGENVLSVTGLL